MVPPSWIACQKGGDLAGMSAHFAQMQMGHVLKDIDLVLDLFQRLKSRLEFQIFARTGGSPLMRIDTEREEVVTKRIGA